MACYETVFIARQDLSDKQTADLTEGFTKIINDNGGKVANTERWGLRTLAYKVNKNRKGHYVLFHIDSEHAAVAEMERNMRLSEDILRYMTVRIDEIPSEPTVMMGKSREGDS